ncbi:hypothetical protein [Polyangium spumosum]|uniref:TIGR02646 family protein n=1 Tax=Polyangium spumosum TaxID=889282 RepID=A0A6N7PX04_9BACT|nr:hypothetical protein [Polyangium spumosum]MRG96762.1 hypothetical protein [Polyangium spumosum]
MRRVIREPLSEETLARLCQRTLQIARAGNDPKHTRTSDRCQARKAEADRLWDQEKTKAFDEIDRVLRRMAPGNEQCMYCECSKGSDIEHFWPKEKYPGRAYTWENYLWACGICNTHFKGTQFPRDAQGKPLLVNPTDEDEEPSVHLQFTPSSGKLVGLTDKGDWTVRVLGFDRRANLDRDRRDAWRGLQNSIVQYAAACARGDENLALYTQGVICRHPMASVLRTLFDLLDSPRGAELVDADCRAAIHAHPEIRSWP